MCQVQGQSKETKPFPHIFLLSSEDSKGLVRTLLPPFRGLLLWPIPRQGCGHFQREKGVLCFSVLNHRGLG